jgi:RNA polymerase sigma factor for flagellar operon FliA
MTTRENRPAPPAASSVPGGADPHDLIVSHQGLVRSLAWKIQRRLPPSVDIEDLIAFGEVGLAEAARAFDPARGGKFTTYAYYRVRGAIFDGLSKMNWFTLRDYHASHYERLANDVVERSTADRQDSGAGGDAEHARWLKGVAGTLAVIQLALPGDDDESAAASLVDDSAPSPAALVLEKELRDMLHELIGLLPSDAGSLIRSVYFDGVTLEEAGRRIGISKAWASRLHARTLARLAHSLRLLGVEG